LWCVHDEGHDERPVGEQEGGCEQIEKNRDVTIVTNVTNVDERPEKRFSGLSCFFCDFRVTKYLQCFFLFLLVVNMFDVMKLQEIAGSIFIKSFLILFVLILFSCNRTDKSLQKEFNERKAFNEAFTKAMSYKVSNPDSALILTGKALDLMQNLQFTSNDSLYLLLEIKSDILSRKNHLDSALRLLTDARLAENARDDKLFQAKIALQLGILEKTFKKYDFSGTHLLESIMLFEELGQDDLLATAYNSYGNLLMLKNENNKALEFQLKAYKILDSLNNAPELCNVCMSIANLFYTIGSRDEELRYSLLGLKAALKTDDSACEIALLNNLGVYYRKLNPDSARFYYERIIARSAPGNIEDALQARYNIANLYFDQKLYNQALTVYHEILEQCLAGKISMGVASAYSGIASVNSRMGNHGKAIEYCRLALQYADSTGLKPFVIRLKQNLHIYYKRDGNFKDAYFTAIEIMAFNDSTQALEKKVALHELEIRYQTEKKEAENARLQMEVDSQKKISESRAYIIFLLIVIALLLIFFSWKGYSLYRERRNAYNVLMQKYNDEKARRELAEVLKKDASNEEKPSVSVSQLDPLIENLILYYENEKPYLDPKLRVDDVAAKLNTTQKAIASSLKQYSNSNFNLFTNQYRIEEAKRIMENLSDSFYKVESVAYDSGFGSKSSFYVAFEQFTGVKPSYYRSFMLDKKGVLTNI
jgi:AraC-like DNA-binding protein/tetratricopeptide (TPR) repeat protein